MIKKNKKNGFAMVEILIAAVTVVSVFALLYNAIFPLVGSYKASENYDDIDSKYVAFYIKEMLETDYNFNLIKNNNFASIASSYKGFAKYKTYAYLQENEMVHYDLKSILDMELVSPPSGSSTTGHYQAGNELCNLLRENSNQKNNRYFCHKYVGAANVMNIYITHYNTSKFKQYVKNHTNEFSRSFIDYIKYMPSYSANTVKSGTSSGYYRIIVEIEHESYTTIGEKYFTYSSIEVKG